MVHKVAIIGGAGSVGSTVAYSLILRRVATEIILVDIDEKRLEGSCLSWNCF
jgi:L-lactate dehydrogenase